MHLVPIVVLSLLVHGISHVRVSTVRAVIARARVHSGAWSGTVVAITRLGYLEDTCAGGMFTDELQRAKEWSNEADALAELAACEIDPGELELELVEVVRVVRGIAH